MAFSKLVVLAFLALQNVNAFAIDPAARLDVGLQNRRIMPVDNKHLTGVISRGNTVIHHNPDDDDDSDDDRVIPYDEKMHKDILGRADLKIGHGRSTSVKLQNRGDDDDDDDDDTAPLLYDKRTNAIVEGDGDDDDDDDDDDDGRDDYDDYGSQKRYVHRRGKDISGPHAPGGGDIADDSDDDDDDDEFAAYASPKIYVKRGSGKADAADYTIKGLDDDDDEDENQEVPNQKIVYGRSAIVKLQTRNDIDDDYQVVPPTGRTANINLQTRGDGKDYDDSSDDEVRPRKSANVKLQNRNGEYPSFYDSDADHNDIDDDYCDSDDEDCYYDSDTNADSDSDSDADGDGDADGDSDADAAERRKRSAPIKRRARCHHDKH